MENTTLTCFSCQKTFERYAARVSRLLKIKPNYKFYCSITCKGYSQVKNCDQCGLEIKVESSRLKNYTNHFCGRACSASFNNKKRAEEGFTLKGKTKIVKCIKCENDVDVALQSQDKNILCKKCQELDLIERKSISARSSHLLKTVRISTCTICQNSFKTFYPKSKFCSNECRLVRKIEIGKKAGAASVIAQQRRSKNEILFGELCAEKFETKCNEQFFIDHNGYTWDADVILPELKIAVLWNGAWHYKKIKTNGSLEQIQTRDQIKLDVIKNNGYYPYVVKDMGRYNENFVKEKFDEFLDFTKTDYLSTLNNQEEIGKYFLKVQENVNLRPKREKAKPVKLVWNFCSKSFERSNGNRPELKGNKSCFCSRECFWNSMKK